MTRIATRQHAVALGLGHVWDQTHAPAPERPATGQPGPWTLILEDFNPLSLNVLMRKHWAAARRVKQLTTELIALACREAGVPPATSKRRVSMVVTIHRGRTGLDDDNAWKLILDCCVMAGVLVDDSPEWLQRLPLVTERGKRKGTRITLEDVG